MGHRNPWRITMINGDLWEIETGWYTNEEINLLLPGKNYGWPCKEGITPTLEVCPPPVHEFF